MIRWVSLRLFSLVLLLIGLPIRIFTFIIVKITILIRMLVKKLIACLLSPQDRCETTDQFEEMEELDNASLENHFIEPPENHRKIYRICVAKI